MLPAIFLLQLPASILEVYLCYCYVNGFYQSPSIKCKKYYITLAVMLGFLLCFNRTITSFFSSSNPSTDFYTWRPQDPIFVVGNGTGTEDRSNAFVVLKNGDAKVKGNLEAASVKISTPAGGIPMGEFGQ